MESNPSPQCHHIKTSGVRCGSPALRDRRYCYYHQRSRPLLLNFARENENPQLFSLPVFEDAHAIQFTLRNVAHRLLDGALSHKTAGLLFYALQIASSNLKQMKAETPQPDQVVVDPPKLSEISRQAPTAEAVPLNSHTPRLTYYPETPSTKDEYRDDIKRQAREMYEQLAFQTREEKRKAKAGKNETSKPSDSSGPNDGLPPGTIQACARSRRRAERPRYVN